MDNQIEKILEQAHLTMAAMAEKIIMLKDENKGLQETNQQNSLELETWHRVTDSTDLFDMAEAAKVVNFEGVGRNKLFDFLRAQGVLMSNNQPYQSEVDAKRFDMIETHKADTYGNERIFIKTMVTQKGVDYIRKLLSKVINGKE